MLDKLTQKDFIGCFNASHTRSVLDRYIFRNLSEVQNTQKPDKKITTRSDLMKLDNLTPLEYREELIKRKKAV